MITEITLFELEQAINYWRALCPSVGEYCALSPEVNALAVVYANMIFNRARSMPIEKVDATSMRLLQEWHDRGNDTRRSALA